MLPVCVFTVLSVLKRKAMNPGQIFCIAGLHQWKEEKVKLANDVYREERHCNCCGKKQIHIRMYPKVRHLAVYRLSKYASYREGDVVDTLTRHSIIPVV